jgi:hypothetical protein
MCSKKLKGFFLKLIFGKDYNHRPKISLLIPFSSKDPIRKRSFKWLLKYWKNELPDAEIIIGRSKSKIFCKGEALNDAARRSTGRILIIMDADGYMDGKVLERCADRILEEQRYGHKLWYVPYLNLYRLKKHITEKILSSNPKNPLRLNCPVEEELIEKNGHKSKYGHRYGAMVMMFPREAYYTLGCFDERFKGWGGEDVALLRALDTLYAKHKTYRSCIYHLWHPFIGYNYKDRRWVGQDKGSVNSELANKYYRATRHPEKMKDLINNGCHYKFLKDKNNGRTTDD